MPIVNLNDLSDSKLKLLVREPFDETRESIVEKLIDEELIRRGLIFPPARLSTAAQDRIENLICQDPTQNMKAASSMNSIVAAAS